MQKNSKYDWHYSSIGGVMRVNIETGQDIAHLGELDQKLWTVLSCPTKGLEFCEKTLQLMDTDGDGKIRVNEIVAVAEWLCNVLADPQILIDGSDGVRMSDFSGSADGQRLKNIAQQILGSLGVSGDTITVADTSDSIAIFSKTRFNGDGVITTSSTEDESLKDIIIKVMECIGSTVDRSGENGINQESLEKFYKACSDYSEWCNSVNGVNLPYGDDTATALEVSNAIRSKIADYFMRCKLIAFHEDASSALDVQVAKIESISEKDLSTMSEDIAEYPLARPNKECLLYINGVVNPSWKAAFDRLKQFILDKEFPEKEAFSEEEWNAVLAKLDAYKLWMASKIGTEVESLGIEVVNRIVSENRQSDLQAIIDQDNAVADEVNAIAEVDKLLYFKRDFYKLLRNYVTMADFYSRKEESKAVFQCGTLYIDQRCLDLCVKVDDMGKHADMAGLSAMYLVYCTCTSKVKGQSMNIVAVLTDGDIDGMRVGKNAVFYDRSGLDWDAVVTKIVDNPISIRQAFWSPYRKLGNFITDKINKSAAEKEANSIDKLTSKTDAAITDVQTDMEAAKENPEAYKAVQSEKRKQQAFDIAKFAGIFASIGLALGLIGDMFTGLVTLIAAKWYNIFILVFGIVMVVSGPSMFIAWTKLRKRNLGPVLNANGWAINSKILVNILFGATLTNMAKYPKMDIHSLSDPFVQKKSPVWKKWLCGVVVVVIVAFATLFVTDNLKCIGLPFHKNSVEAIAPNTAEIGRADSLIDSTSVELVVAE